MARALIRGVFEMGLSLGLGGIDWAELGDFAAAHLNLVVEAIAIATTIGVPLGILATRSRWLERSVVGVANILQTVPSLALLGVLLALFRGTIGKPPALAALVIYALLPIIKNTVLGLRGIDRGVAEAALGLGMTARQRLLLVELPLAVPIILGGVRVAAVAAVGMATIAAAIGAKGLGSYIFRGVQLNSTHLILLGSIPAALLALACDAALGEAESALSPARPRRSKLRGWLAGGAIVILLGAAAWGGREDFRGWRGGERPIVIGGKDDPESNVLAHLLADLVEDRTGLKVDRRLNLGGTMVCYQALKSGGIDAYPEYTGTALTTILHEPPMSDPLAVLRRIREVAGTRDGVACLDPLGFENTFAILVRKDQAELLGLHTISDLLAHQGTLKPGFGPEFMNRPDGYPGLVVAYGLKFAHAPREMDRNLLYQAVAAGTLDVAAGDSTDGRIEALGLTVLKDDRRYFPPYEAVPLANAASLGRHPELRDALDALAGMLDAPTMRRLNREVEAGRKDPAVVAREYLRGAGLLKREAAPKR